MTAWDWLVWVWRWDEVLQGAGLALSLCGVALSMWLAWEAHQDYRAVATNGALERRVARAHRRSQVVILVLQIGFAGVSALTLTLPPVAPMAEHLVDYPGGWWVLFTIFARKLLRAGLIIILVIAAVRQANDRRLVLRTLRAATD